jgi:segregation and condensation protein B
METLAIIAYHQPVTRAEIEEIRGVGLSRGTLDLLLEAGWVAPKGRRRTAGRPVTWGTATGFLVEFGIESITDLPGLDDLKAAGLLDKRPAMQIDEFRTSGLEEDDTEEDDSLDEGREEIDIPEPLSGGETSREEQDGIGAGGQDPTGSEGNEQNEGNKGLTENINRD